MGFSIKIASTDHGVMTLGSCNSPPNTPYSIPKKCDTLVCYSTLDGKQLKLNFLTQLLSTWKSSPIGHLAEVSWETGTKFGEALADSFIEKASYRDLAGILTRVS